MASDDSGLRSRIRAIPRMPIFPDLNSNSIVEESSEGTDQPDSGNEHKTSNGEAWYFFLILIINENVKKLFYKFLQIENIFKLNLNHTEQSISFLYVGLRLYNSVISVLFSM